MRVLILVSATCLLVAVAISAHGAGGPDLLLTAERIVTIKTELRAGNPLISDAYRQLISDADACLSLSPDPIVGELKVPGFYRKPDQHRKIVSRLRRDAQAANCLALAFALSGEERYGLKSKEFLLAWVSSLGRPRDAGDLLDLFMMSPRGDTPLVISYSFPHFIYAFDILNSLDLLSEEEAAAFRNWLRVYVDYCTDECPVKNNWHNWQSLFLMCAGRALRDDAVFERGVSYYKRGFRVQVAKDGALPLELWREEKCATYTLMALEAMIQGAHIAATHGRPEILELRSKENAGLRDAVDCLLDFLDDPDNWQVKRRKANPGFKKQNRPEDKSDWGWLLELPRSLWKDERYAKYMQKRPYGNGARAYTLTYPTLLFADPRDSGVE